MVGGHPQRNAMSSRMRNNRLYVAALFVAFSLISHSTSLAQCSAIIDLNTWSQEGPAANGSWAVNVAGTQVTQGINGLPTFFVSPQNFINVRMNGTIVTTGGDDDFIGFVFGYRGPFGGGGPNYNVNTWLFDWKRGTQTVGGFTVQQGRYLCEVNGPFDLTNQAGVGPTFWGHTNQPGFTVTQSTTGGGTGWAVGTTYNFELTYLADRTVIVVNNDTFFDVAGCFEPGRFGFYNYSQNPVVYSNFSYTLLPNFSMSGTNICLTDTAQFAYTQDTCSSSSLVNSVIASWDWDFGDGNTDTTINPSHQYASTGNYTVQLVVTDSIGCQDSLSQNITVSPVPATPTAGNNGPICEGASLNLTGLGAGVVNYNWTGPNGFSSNTQNPVINPTVAADSGQYVLTVDDGNCTSLPDTTLAIVHSPPPAPVLGSNSPVCADSLLTLTAATIPGATYTWTGPNGFSSALQNPSIPNPSTAASGAYSVFATVNGCPGPSASINVTVNPTPVAGITGDSTICPGGTATLTASGGTGFLWSTGASTQSVNVSPSADSTYWVTVSSAAGCPSLPDSITVLVGNVPLVNMGNDTTVCDQMPLDAGAGMIDYLWNTSAVSQSIQVTSSGTYQVTVMNIDSCFSSDTINVTVNSTIPVDLGPDQNICPGGTATLLAGPGPFSTYDWSTLETTASIDVTTAGNYSVNVIDVNGCPSTDNVNVNVWPPLAGDLGPNTTICDDSSMVLDASGFGGATYAWMPGGQVTSAISISAAGTYSVVVDDGNGCLYHDTISISLDVPPAMTLTSNLSTICQWDPVNFNASPGGLVSYTFFDNGAAAQSGGSQTFGTGALLPANSVTVVGMTAAGCPTDPSNAISITVLPRPTGSPLVSTVCEGQSTDLSVILPNGVTGTWSGGGGMSGSGTTVSHTYPASGVYNYTLVLDNGICDTTIAGLVNVLPLPVAPLIGDQSACEGAEISINPAGLGSFEWYDTAVGGNLIGSGPNYTIPAAATTDTLYVETTVATGCTSPRTEVVVTVFPNPVADFISNPDSSVDLNIPNAQLSLMNLSTGASNYFWNFGDGNSSIEFSPVHNYSENGEYTVTLIASSPQNCRDTLSRGLYRVINEHPVYIPTAFTPNGDDLNENFEISTFGIEYYDLEIFDRWGKWIFSNGGDMNKTWDGTIGGQPAPEGVYVYRMTAFITGGEELLFKGTITLMR